MKGGVMITRDKSFNRSHLIILMRCFLLFLFQGIRPISGFNSSVTSEILSLHLPDIRLSTDKLI